MILIADSGGTKTSWRLIDSDDNISQAQTKGFNPYHHDIGILVNEIELNLFPQLNISTDKIEEIYFYGAGCSAPENVEKISNALKNLFSNSKVNVNHDLLAAAHALCGNEAGIACILGTGANSCYFDGKNIIQNVPSLGYILGDEGSGSFLGKQLLIAYINKELPGKIVERLESRFSITKDTILQEVYRGEAPARYLASFAKFIFQNLKEPELYLIVYKSLKLFFEKNVMKYPNYKKLPVHFTGSIAFYYANILRQVASELQINVRNITEDPIAGLTLYHLQQKSK